MIVVKPKPSRLKEFAPEVKQSSGVKREGRKTVFRGHYSGNNLKEGDIVYFITGSSEHYYPVGTFRVITSSLGDNAHKNGLYAVYHVVRDGVFL